jgi:hypothetical protein
MRKPGLAPLMGSILLLGGGCASFQEDLVKQAALEVEAIPSKDFDFTGIQVTQEGSIITISGNLRHTHRLTAHQHAGRVEITATDEKGAVVATTEVPYRIRHPHSAYYRFSAAMSAASASKVRLEQHLRDSDEDPNMDSG